MDLVLAGLRDRRIAAADEAISVRGGAIYGRGSHARRPGIANPGQAPFDRPADAVKAIVLHQTSGPLFTASDLPAASSDSTLAGHRRIDRITAHFLVLADGVVVYLRDVQYILSDAGGRLGIDIEFTGHFGNENTPRAPRLSTAAIQAGRRLVAALKRAIPGLESIHPHGQVQKGATGKLHSCCGPDVWVNVGEWASSTLHLSNTPNSYYQDHGISSRQSNAAYRQTVPG